MKNPVTHVARTMFGSTCRGDTIVEVLIAITIVSSVLLGAFLVSQKSTVAVRDSQEHAEVTQLLNGQVEQVRLLALHESSDTQGVYATNPKYFCVGMSGSNAGKRINFSSAAVVGDTSTYPSECKDIQNYYAIAIAYDPATKVFRFNGSWDSVTGSKAQQDMVYRMYPGLRQ